MSTAETPKKRSHHLQVDESSPLFSEYLKLLGEVSLETPGGPIGQDDALLIIDMQNDFVPKSTDNPNGGKLGVAEGDAIEAPITEMIAG